MSTDLYDHPGLYEALFPIGAHLPYYLDLARRADGEVLELACGTGQLTVPIAAAGVQITGLDESQPMLSLARERAVAANLSVEHLHADMRSFDLGRQFGLIYIARNSLLHLHSTEDILASFAAVRRHLAPGGWFAFDIFNPSLRLLARPPGQRLPTFEIETEAFGKPSVGDTTDYDAAPQVNRPHSDTPRQTHQPADVAELIRIFILDYFAVVNLYYNGFPCDRFRRVPPGLSYTERQSDDRHYGL